MTNISTFCGEWSSVSITWDCCTCLSFINGFHKLARVWNAFVLSVSCCNPCVCFLKNYYAGWINWRTSCRSGTHNHILAKSWKVSCYSSKFTIFESGMSCNIIHFFLFALCGSLLSNLPNLKSWVNDDQTNFGCN